MSGETLELFERKEGITVTYSFGPCFSQIRPSTPDTGAGPGLLIQAKYLITCFQNAK
jgi:hypothetical protein